MGDKLGIMVKKILITLSLIVSFNIISDEVPEKINFSQKIISATDGLSGKEESRIYNLKASKNRISINSSRIGRPKLDSFKNFGAPSRSDKYIIEVLDEDMNVIRMIGLGNPFYIHVQSCLKYPLAALAASTFLAASRATVPSRQHLLLRIWLC